MALMVCVGGCGGPDRLGTAGAEPWLSPLNKGLMSAGFDPLPASSLDIISIGELFGHGSRPGPYAWVRQIHQYLSDPVARHAARDEVARLVADDTRIVLGHSLGSVAAYEALCRLTDSPVRLFVTLGSPLGIRPHVFDRLGSVLTAGRRSWPAGLDRWINLFDRRDVVAFRRLTPLFGNGRQIAERAVANGVRPHRASSYLADSVLARELGLAARRWAATEAHPLLSRRVR